MCRRCVPGTSTPERLGCRSWPSSPWSSTLSRLGPLAERYSYADDSALRAAGRAAVERGHYEEDEFLTVCRWKASRVTKGFSANSGVQIRAATGLAFSRSDEAKRMEALTSLAGVGVPIGSTLLQFAFPTQYPILDWRALEALGAKKRSQYPIDFWTSYLAACRRIAGEAGVDVRTLDKALWQWSRERTAAAG